MAGIFQRLTQLTQRMSWGQTERPQLTRKDIEGPPETASYKSIHNHFWGRYPRDLPPFTFLTIQTMLFDPTIKLGLAMRAAPIYGLEFARKEGKEWIPGIRATSTEVGEFVLKQLDRIWQNDLDAILTAQIWGWSAGEITLRAKDGKVEIDRLLPRHANDTRARVRGGELCGVRVLRCPEAKDGYVDLRWPKSWWHVYAPEYGRNYGDSALMGCYSPWYDKWMEGGGIEVRRLFMHKDAYAGADLTYPEGMQNIPGKGEIPNRDIARELVEQVLAGGVTARPAVFDEKGNELWKLTRAKVASNPAHILQYPKDLDVEILRGLECPDDVLSSGETGAWAGKRVPMSAFYSGLDRWAGAVIRDLDKCVIRPLVVLNFGGEADYSITHKPLAEQAMEQQGETAQKQPVDGDGDGDGGGSPFDDLFGGGGQQQRQVQGQGQNGNGQRPQPQRIPPRPGGRPGLPGQRMSLGLDVEDAVGRGVLSASELVQAARRVIRMRLYGLRAPAGGVTIQGKEYKGGEFIPDAAIEAADEDELTAIRGGAKAKADKSIGKTVGVKREDVSTGETTKAGKEKKQSVLVPLEGDSLPAHIKPAMIPPAWKDVMVNMDDEADLWISAKDAKGNVKAVYNPSFQKLTTLQKFARTTSMAKEAAAINSQIQEARQDPMTREEADCAWLMSVQATRPGSDEDARGLGHLFGVTLSADNLAIKEDKKGNRTVALTINGETVPVRSPKTQAELLRRLDAGESLEDSDFWLNSFGATTLQQRHVKITKDGVRLQFVGKEGVWHDHEIKDKELAAMLRSRYAHADGATGKLFNTTDGRTSRFTKKLGSGKYTPKDFRTKRANELAIAFIAKQQPPRTQEELEERIQAVGEHVSGVLGNEAAQALETYINPLVFEQWRHNVGRQSRSAA